MQLSTKDVIIQNTVHLFALRGYSGTSIRLLAQEVGISPSVLYHYFSDKDILLKEVYEHTNKKIGAKRKKLPQPKTAAEMLYQRILFQIDHAEEIVFVLKYLLQQRSVLKRNNIGYLPDKATLHIEEVLDYGYKIGEFKKFDRQTDAKVITHAINGFILEYYPAKLTKKEKDDLADLMYNFIMRALLP